VTEDAGEVTATTARATGTVTPEALPATYYFQYGGTSSYGRQTATAESGAPATPSIELAGLQPGTTYHYRLLATSESEGTLHYAYGEDHTFTTVATPPILTGLNASAITETSATITAALEPQALSTRWELALGATPGSLQPQASGDVTANTPLSIAVSALTPGTAYHYRLTATNLNGTVEPEGVFTTAPAAAAGTEPALPALIPFTPVSQIAAKEDAENKANSKPPVLTNKQKRQKALTVCRRDKRKSKRQACEQRARKRYPLAKKKG
jgi:phosphodiesterase/alkaline phosphatase D-like protein